MKLKTSAIVITFMVSVSIQSSRAAERTPLPEFKSKQELAQKHNALEAVAGNDRSNDYAFYTGKPFDTDSEGYLFKYRRFNPEINRWTSVDPSGFPDQANSHIYGNNPVAGFDCNGLAWSNWDFVYHFYFGGGTSVDLAATGLLGRIQTFAEASPNGGAFRFGNQISENARDKAPYNGSLTDSFERSYNFESISFAMGDATLKGSFSGNMYSQPNSSGKGGTYTYDEGGTLAGDMTVIYLTDKFEDPLDLLEKVYGSSNPQNAPAWFKALGNVGGTPYAINGNWTENYHGGGTYE